MTTWRDLWIYGTRYLEQKGIETPRLDAEILLRYLANMNKEQFYCDLMNVCPGDMGRLFQEILDRRAQGTPVSYITGEKEFYGLSFQVNPAVLIPRPETELLVERALELFAQGLIPDGSWMLDIGTGSGAIGISVAAMEPKAQIIATDISVPALMAAANNARQHRVDAQVHFEVADLWPSKPHLDRLLVGRRRFGLIVSNPPYIESTFMDDLALELHQEPALALDGGPDGLNVYRRLVAGLDEYLLPEGYVLLEVGANQAGDVCGLLAASGLQILPPIFDLAGHPRVVQAKKETHR